MDSSIYGALVWLSQPWNMRYPLIDFHGNNGSRDGDEPAASRYTECKLSKVGEAMLDDIKKDTTDWQLAYTDEEDEPVYLPGYIPNLLVNGTSGIAVAMACSFAPHNLNEIINAAIYQLQNPNCKCADLLQFVKGPDFPTGGLIINKDELKQIYLTGKGRAKIRGEYIIESDKNGRDTIVFTSIPYKVSKEKLITDIDQLCEEGTLQGITSIRDETNIEGVRFVIELAKGISASTIIPKLFKNTGLEDTYSVNQVALVDKKPQLWNLQELLNIYIKHQQDVLVRKTNYELAKAKARLNILEGLLVALNNIDDVVAIIKNSASAAAAKEKLMASFELNEAQAKAILDLKLSRLAKLEKEEVEQEKIDVETQIKRLTEILENPIIELEKIFTKIKENFGDARRTSITQINEDPVEKEIVDVTPEKCVVVLTESGLIKRVPTASFRQQHKNGTGIKTQDDITSMIIRTNTIDNLMIFTDKGMMYRLLVNDIPVGTNASKGQSIKSLIAIPQDENPTVIYSIYRDTDAKYVLFTTKNGYVKKTPLEDYLQTKKKNGIAAINFQPNDELVSVTLIKDEELILLTKNGFGIRFSSSEISPGSRVTIGVIGTKLTEGDEVIACLPIRDNTDDLAIFYENGMSKKLKLTEIMPQKRGGRGYSVAKSPLAAASLVSKTDSVLVIGDKTSICISAEEIPEVGRTANGTQIIKNNKILTVSKV